MIRSSVLWPTPLELVTQSSRVAKLLAPSPLAIPRTGLQPYAVRCPTTELLEGTLLTLLPALPENPLAPALDRNTDLPHPAGAETF